MECPDDLIDIGIAIIKLISTAPLVLRRLYRQVTQGLEIEAGAPQLYRKIGAEPIAELGFALCLP
jgi:hypothetical protein